MSDINEVKLKRLIDHYNDEGENTPEAVAGVLKAKPENTGFLERYVDEAGKRLEDPTLLEDFQSAPEPSDEEETPPPAPKKAPAQEGELTSTAEDEEQEPAAPEIIDPPRELSLGDMFLFRYRDAKGASHPLRVVHQKNNIVLLGDMPTDDIVTVKLGGQDVELNLTTLERTPGGDTVETSAGNFPAATLLVIAQAAKG